MSNKLYVGNLSYDTTEIDLQDTFAEAGTVTEVALMQDKFTGKSRGFGFVEMPDDAAAQKAVTELDQASVENRTIRVMEAKPKEDRKPRTNNFSRSNSY